MIYMFKRDAAFIPTYSSLIEAIELDPRFKLNREQGGPITDTLLRWGNKDTSAPPDEIVIESLGASDSFTASRVSFPSVYIMGYLYSLSMEEPT